MAGLIVLVLVLLARAYPGQRRGPRRLEADALVRDGGELELEDVQQMIEAQNAYRRRRGAPELTEADADRMADEDNAIRERARANYDERLDELEDEFGV